MTHHELTTSGPVDNEADNVSQIARDAAVGVEALKKECNENCNFLVYGSCRTRSCYLRGGWVEGPTEGFNPTCVYRELHERMTKESACKQATEELRQQLAEKDATIENLVNQIVDLKLFKREQEKDTKIARACESSFSQGRRIIAQSAEIERLREALKKIGVDQPNDIRWQATTARDALSAEPKCEPAWEGWVNLYPGGNHALHQTKNRAIQSCEHDGRTIHVREVKE